jgi:hypothetical protein
MKQRAYERVMSFPQCVKYCYSSECQDITITYGRGSEKILSIKNIENFYPYQKITSTRVEHFSWNKTRFSRIIFSKIIVSLHIFIQNEISQAKKSS